MKITNKKDFFTGLIALLLSAWIIWMSLGLPESPYDGDPGSKMFPMIGGTLMGICGILLMIKQGEQTKQFLTKEQWKSCGKIFGVYVGFLVLMYVFGWTIGMPITLFALTYLLSGISMADATKKKRLLTSLIWAVLCGAGIYLAYKVGLKARVPQGLLIKLMKKWF